MQAIFKIKFKYILRMNSFVCHADNYNNLKSIYLIWVKNINFPLSNWIRVSCAMHFIIEISIISMIKAVINISAEINLIVNCLNIQHPL